MSNRNIRFRQLSSEMSSKGEERTHPAGGSKGGRQPPFLCPVCVDDDAGPLVTCDGCGAGACRACARRYFADRAPGAPLACMACRRPFTRDALREHFSAAFVDRESAGARRAALVAADAAFDRFTIERVMPLVRAHDAALSRVDACLSELTSAEVALAMARRKRHAAARAHMLARAAGCARAARRKRTVEDDDDANANAVLKMTRHVRQLAAATDAAVERARRLRARILGDDAAALASLETTAPPRARGDVRMLRCSASGCASGVFRCGADAEDGGGADGSTGACMVCGARHCVTCAALLNDETPLHACDADAVSTVRTLMSATRGCPRCAAAIERADGCDQMMCVACRCIFDYSTGREVMRGVVHNPHFKALPEAERADVLSSRAARAAALPSSSSSPLNTLAFRSKLAAALAAEPRERDDALEILQATVNARASATRAAALADPDAERAARLLRLRRMLGHGLGRVVRLPCAHPLAPVAGARAVLPSAATPGLSAAAHAAALARLDARRRAASECVRAAAEFLALAEPALRVLASGAAERGEAAPRLRALRAAYAACASAVSIGCSARERATALQRACTFKQRESGGT